VAGGERAALRSRRLAIAALVLASCRPPASLDADASVALAAAPEDTGVSATVPSASAAPVVAAPPATSDWCVDGLSVLDEDVCYVLPPLPAGQPRRLLVYLHGIVPPTADSPQKHTVQGVVLHASVRAGVAALVPRGRRGLGPANARDWWGWPTTSDAVAEHAPSIIRRLAEARRKLESVAGVKFERTYLAGSSSGAYFVAALAAHGELFPDDFPVDGFGAMSGGGAGEGSAGRLGRLPPRPFYVGFGTYDDDTKAKALSLVSALRAAHWPVRVAEHPLGHGANEIYLDEAFAFWHESDVAPAPTARAP
jgi:predicted esterase